jgi:hypothetical protein
MKIKNETKTKMFGNEKFTFEKCCTGNHDLKTTEQRLRNDGYLIRTEFMNGKHYVYKKDKALHKNYWGTTSQFWNRNPLLPKQVNGLRALTLDSDKDGKHDWEDCEPLNPKKQDVEGEFKTPQGNIPFRTRYTPHLKNQIYKIDSESIKRTLKTGFNPEPEHFSEKQYLEGKDKAICPNCEQQDTFKVFKDNPNLFYCENCRRQFLIDEEK